MRLVKHFRLRNLRNPWTCTPNGQKRPDPKKETGQLESCGKSDFSIGHKLDVLLTIRDDNEWKRSATARSSDLKGSRAEFFYFFICSRNSGEKFPHMIPAARNQGYPCPTLAVSSHRFALYTILCNNCFPANYGISYYWTPRSYRPRLGMWYSLYVK